MMGNKMYERATKMHKVTDILVKHYETSLEKYGATPRGMDWGDRSETLELRFNIMLQPIQPTKTLTLLDVGCGAGLLLDYIYKQGYTGINYAGIDASKKMVDAAIKKHPEGTFFCRDICDSNLDLPQYDYVVANGLFTVRSLSTIQDMDNFFEAAVNAMFKHCKRGIAFNIMSKYVDFEVDHLYYRLPGDIIEYCVKNLSRYVTIYHNYQLYEFFTFVYKKPLYSQ